MMRWVGYLAGVLLGLAALSYVGDWAVWRIRVARGGGMGQVTVGRLQVVQLKGNQEIYYPDGSSSVDCSRSLYPQAGAGRVLVAGRSPDGVRAVANVRGGFAEG